MSDIARSASATIASHGHGSHAVKNSGVAAAEASGSAPLLDIRGLVKHFPVRRGLFGRDKSAVRAVDGVDLVIEAGETLGVVGESGCGKSTLGRLALRLIEPTAGTVTFEGRDLAALGTTDLRAQRRSMQLIFQDPYSSLNPRMTVQQTLTEPLMLHGLHTGRHRERVAELLRTVGLSPEQAQRYPHEFSGGQRQRVGIARALAGEPKLIVCDEAVSALDVSVQAQVVNLLQDLQKQLGLALMFIAHDLAVVKHIATRIAVMYLGRIVEICPTGDLFDQPRHPYTQALLSAIPLPEPGAQRERVLLPGDVPSPLNPPSGCHFHTRCPHARPLCSQQTPLLEGEGGHAVACHFWREIAKPQVVPPPVVLTAARQRLDLLQSAFGAPLPVHGLTAGALTDAATSDIPNAAAPL
ncbi:MAG: dipeptide transporter ATP-binding protein [Rhizobacter sp.]|nr:dipeptide transporter ATP-binding protein [Rhizobacter sp.]